MDDLKTGRGAEYLDASSVTLVFCSSGYFQSPNCMRELLRAAVTSKPIVALLEPEAKHGGLTDEQIHAQLREADGYYEAWGLSAEVESWGYALPDAEALHASLFTREPIEWNRVGFFQDVTMRLIAEHLLPSDTAIRRTYLQGERARQAPALKAPRHGLKYHVYCSPHNGGARELMIEVGRCLKFTTSEPKKPLGAARRIGPRLGDNAVNRSFSRFVSNTPLRTAERYGKLSVERHKLRYSSSPECMLQCEHFLVYLTSQTWTSGDASKTFADDVRRAMECQIPLLLCHEMPGIKQANNHGCTFDLFFACADGATPQDLLKAGIYNAIATPLKGGEWRKVSLVKVAEGIAEEVPKRESNEGAGEAGLSMLSPSGRQTSLTSPMYSRRRRRHTGLHLPSTHEVLDASQCQVAVEMPEARRAAPMLYSSNV